MYIYLKPYFFDFSSGTWLHRTAANGQAPAPSTTSRSFSIKCKIDLAIQSSETNIYKKNYHSVDDWEKIIEMELEDPSY